MTYGATMSPVPRGGAAEGRTGTLKKVVASTPTQGQLPTGGLSELSENEIQKAVFLHLRIRGAKGAFWFHPKNASADMAGRKAGIHFALGVEPGIPDVIVFKRRLPDCDVYALELKQESRRSKKLTKHELKQFACRNVLARCGVTVGIAYGLDDAIAWLERYGLLVGRTT